MSSVSCLSEFDFSASTKSGVRSGTSTFALPRMALTIQPNQGHDVVNDHLTEASSDRGMICSGTRDVPVVHDQTTRAIGVGDKGIGYLRRLNTCVPPVWKAWMSAFKVAANGTGNIRSIRTYDRRTQLEGTAYDFQDRLAKAAAKGGRRFAASSICSSVDSRTSSKLEMLAILCANVVVGPTPMS